MAGSVYIKTSISSAYVSTRTDPSSLHRRNLTRAWWNTQLHRYDAWVSENVLIELEEGSWRGQAEAIELLGSLPKLPVSTEVIAVASRLIEERLVPNDPGGDAVHVAAACVHEMDFLLTWNIRHLANPNKTTHLTVISRRLGLLPPQIVTPEMLWLEEEP